MSATRASGANRTSARGGGSAPRDRVTGWSMLNDAVWNEVGWFVTSVPITPACNRSTSAPRLDDQASVRGDRLAKNPAIRAEMLGDSDGLAAGPGPLRPKQFPHGARGRRAQGFIEIDGLGVLFPDRRVLPGKLGIAGQRLIDPAGIARIERTGRMPGQQHFYFTGILFQHFLAHCHHGQPRSMPAALSSSANFLPA